MHLEPAGRLIICNDRISFTGLLVTVVKLHVRNKLYNKISPLHIVNYGVPNIKLFSQNTTKV